MTEGCGATTVEPTSWGAIKASFRQEDRGFGLLPALGQSPAREPLTLQIKGFVPPES